MQLAMRQQYAVDVFADRLKDGQIHYGLVFAIPANTDCAAAQKHSDLDTRSRHGQVTDWWLGVPCSTLPYGQAALLIPRTWLIRQGFLPWWVMFLPYRRFAMRKPDALREHVWLEWPLRNSANTERDYVDLPDPSLAVARAA